MEYLAFFLFSGFEICLWWSKENGELGKDNWFELVYWLVNKGEGGKECLEYGAGI